MILRENQEECVTKCVEHFKKKNGEHAICVVPTGGGKSYIIAATVQRVSGNFLILQPSKEILEQNIEKYRLTGNKATIYSASMKEKKISETTFCTIGSIFENSEMFKLFDNVIIDECHFVNPEEGMYNLFLNSFKNLSCIGLTATPYRISKSSGGKVTEFITRMRPQFFKKVLHVTQQSELIEKELLAEIKYVVKDGAKMQYVKITGDEYNEESMEAEYKRVGMDKILRDEIAREVEQGKSVLVFCVSIEMAHATAQGTGTRIITGKTETKERERVLEEFKKKRINAVINVGVLTTGFDFPALDCIIMARGTRSLSLWCQIVGRGQRISDGKECCTVIDLCGNLERLGDVQKMKVVEENGKWMVKIGTKQLTNKYND